MSKGKKPSDDQPELPLAGTPAPETPRTPPAGDQAISQSMIDAPASPAGSETDALTTPVASASIPVAPQNNDAAPLAHSYRNWFLDYASYVILDRAVPHLDDGLKPVQRRILHTLWDKDDGRFHKVANIVGATMAFHPHGDASIGAALVGMGQRGWLIEPQGNYGNTLTGDDAAAPRYIECRLTPFAREVLFNPKTTAW
ncbi:MAG: hypothetical protein RLZZ50_1958, partial [Verrucomicrobiota bacterium]